MEELDPRFALYLHYRAVLIDYASHLLGSRDGAEDLVQEAFIKFVPAGGGRMPEARPRSYLFRIVHNLAVDVLRRKRLENLRNAHNAPVWTSSQTTPTPEETVLYRESERRAMDIIAGLPEKQRVALEMHRFGEYSVEEVAAHLGVSVPTVYRLIQAAVATVTIRLERDSNGETNS
ncbi:RNA polymerase sigma factor [Bradyrhizobium sp. BRP22]|uniref:RNA polymerase sigma factor n=1 Tax=Bradyrhizobium sp. BRP22 TaxID=2793821 RepID=UPI001CD73DC6|nr:RNA polymerase sigma factor [Bradyrhizobium sp. BRP22]MCA1454622.1 RNA polymerase sigma factor [Bradyrhizobium sp. BRP22]